VRESLRRLREAGLVLWELIPPLHRLPTGNFARTNVNRYWVNVGCLLSLLGTPHVPVEKAPKSEASTQPNSDASSGTVSRSEESFPPTPRELPNPISTQAATGEAVSKKPEERTTECAGTARERGFAQRRERAENRPGQHLEPHTPSELEPVLASWLKLKLGEPDDRSRRALVNRRAEGASIE
jgi:hypothetical protein